MFAVIFDVEQVGFLSKLAESRDQKKTNLRSALTARKPPTAPLLRRGKIAKNVVSPADF